MTLVESAKTRISTNGTTVKGAFRNEEGAIDLASIMVGIIVIGIIGGVVAATVFAVIPWTQDNAAKQQLESVVTAQSAYIGLQADQTADYNYGTAAELGTAGLFTAPSNVKIAVSDNGGVAAEYAATSESDSGKVFYVTNDKPNAGKNGTTEDSAEDLIS